MTIREALDQAISDLKADILTVLSALLDYRRKGKVGYLWTDFKKIFLSKMEDDATILNLLQTQVTIHKQRGSRLRIETDMELITFSGISYIYYDIKQCGWILGTGYDILASEDSNGESPGFNPDRQTYSPLTSLTYIGMDNMLEITALNGGKRGTQEIRDIARKEFIPAQVNLRVLGLQTVGFGFGEFGEKPFGEIP